MAAIRRNASSPALSASSTVRHGVSVILALPRKKRGSIIAGICTGSAKSKTAKNVRWPPSTKKYEQPHPSGKEIDGGVGEKVILNVKSDTDDEIHAHVVSNYKLPVKAGKPAK